MRYGEDPEYPTIAELPSAEHAANRRHICDACGGWIEPGERYRVHKWTEDGEFQVMKGHARACCQPEVGSEHSIH